MGRKITKLKITELSGVDRPANNLSLVDSMEMVKRADAPDVNAEDVSLLKRALVRIIGLKDEDALAGLLKVAARDDVSGADKKSAKEKYGDVNFADAKNKKYPLDSEEHVRAAWSYINMPKNAGKYSAADLKTIKGKIKAAGKKYKIEFADDANKAELPEDVLKAFEADPSVMLCDAAEDIEKDLYAVSMLAQLVQQLHYVYLEAAAEQDREGDESKVPAMLEDCRNQLAAALTAMAQEETSELTEKVMQLTADAERILKDVAAGKYNIAKSAPAATSETPAVTLETVETLVKVLNEHGQKCALIKGANDVELEALAQGAHDAMAAAGAPPHTESEGGDDVSEGKADTAIDLVKSASGVAEEDRAVILTLMKRGARFSKKTGEQLQKAHDLISKIGAKCDMGKAATSGDLKKMLEDAVNSAISKVSAAKDAQIDELKKTVADLLARPQPLPSNPNGGTLQFSVVDKGGGASAYVAPGTSMVKTEQTFTAPNGAQVTKIVSDATELLPGIKKIHEGGGASGMEGLMTGNGNGLS